MTDREFEIRKLEFEKSLELRNFEIENFWKRGWFFGTLLLAVTAAYFQQPKCNNEFKIYIAFSGFLISVAQTLMNRGSKYWQERWESKTKNKESALGIDITLTKKFGDKEKYFIDATILGKEEHFLAMPRRFSVTKLTFLVWDIVAFFHFLLWIKESNILSTMINFPICHPVGICSYLDGSIRIGAFLIHFLILLYICVFFSSGKVYGEFTTDTEGDDTWKNEYYEHSEKYITNAVGLSMISKKRKQPPMGY